MSRFVKPIETRRIPLGSQTFANGEVREEWVEVRERLTYSQRQHLFGSIVNADISGGDYVAHAEVGKYNPSILRSFVVKWCLYDEEEGGAPVEVPFSFEALDLLDEETGALIVEAVDAMEKSRQEGKAVAPTTNSTPRLITSGR